MQQMSRAQRLLLIYILWKLREPKVIQKITKLAGGGGITEAMAVAAVEGEATLDLSGVVTVTRASSDITFTELAVAGFARTMPLINFNDSLGGQYGAFSGSIMALDIDGAGSSSISLTNAAASNYCFISQTFATSLMDIWNPFGDIRITAVGGDVYPGAANYNFGTGVDRWKAMFTENFDISGRITGNLLPWTTNAQDLGSGPGPFPPPFQWRNLWIDGKAYIDELGEDLSVAGFTLKNVNNLELDEITTPTAVADHGKVYTKNDNKLYFQDGAGVEHEIAFV